MFFKVLTGRIKCSGRSVVVSKEAWFIAGSSEWQRLQCQVNRGFRIDGAGKSRRRDDRPVTLYHIPEDVVVNALKRKLGLEESRIEPDWWSA